MYFFKVGPLCSLDAIKWLYLRPLSSLDKKLFTDTTLWLFTSRSLLLAIFLRNTDDQYQECCCESRSAVFCLYLCLFCLQILAQNANTDQFFVVHPILSRQLEGVSKIDASEIQKRKLFSKFNLKSRSFVIFFQKVYFIPFLHTFQTASFLCQILGNSHQKWQYFLLKLETPCKKMFTEKRLEKSMQTINHPADKAARSL